MKELRFSHKFKKDFKRYRNDPVKLEKLKDMLRRLENEEQIPPEFHLHPLTGEYAGCMECHIGPDFLLIWRDETTGVIYIIRLGSHSELFR